MPQIIYKVGDDISTDIIYPGRYMATVLPTETPKYAFGDDPGFNKALNEGKYPKGGIILAGKNFGCGSSREQAASCLKGHNLTIIAKSFARIFLQNAINLGLPVILCPTIEGEMGDEVEITEKEVINHTRGKAFPIVPLPPSKQAIINAGGLIPYTRKRLLEKAKS